MPYQSLPCVGISGATWVMPLVASVVAVVTSRIVASVAMVVAFEVLSVMVVAEVDLVAAAVLSALTCNKRNVKFVLTILSA